MLTDRLEVRAPIEADRVRFVELFRDPEFMVFSDGGPRPQLCQPAVRPDDAHRKRFAVRQAAGHRASIGTGRPVPTNVHLRKSFCRTDLPRLALIGIQCVARLRAGTDGYALQIRHHAVVAAEDERIYHVASVSDWAEAQSRGEYRMSTRGARLEDFGFIHGSFREQVERIGAFLYGDVDEELVVLVIDPARVHALIKTENLEGGAERFPHIYGPLPIDAVVSVLSAHGNSDGTFTVDGLASGA
jgi:uncharacterized protein (DUF952 family)